MAWRRLFGLRPTGLASRGLPGRGLFDELVPGLAVRSMGLLVLLIALFNSFSSCKKEILLNSTTKINCAVSSVYCEAVYCVECAVELCGVYCGAVYCVECCVECGVCTVEQCTVLSLCCGAVHCVECCVECAVEQCVNYESGTTVLESV